MLEDGSKTSPAATRRGALGLLLGTPMLAACAGQSLVIGPNAAPESQPAAAPGGQVKVGLILPLSAPGNAGVAAQSMKNAAEMALAEFQSTNVQLLVKDDAGNSQTALDVARQAVEEGAEIILGPLFSQSVASVASAARTRNVPVIAFSTDSSVAGRGVYLLSFLPESDVYRIVEYAVGNNKKAIAALLPENAYGNVMDAALKQVVDSKGGRIVAYERYGADRAFSARNLAQNLNGAEALFIADDGDSVAAMAGELTTAGVNLRSLQLLGTGLWDNPRVFATPALHGGVYAAPDPAGYRAFSRRYKARFGSDPVRTATLAYDAAALVAALARAQGSQRFSQENLTNPSGFAGVDGLFRFRSDGTNERGLAVLRVSGSGGQVVVPQKKTFGA